MVNKFDLRFVIEQTFATICRRIELAKVSLILCTDFYLLYQCLIKFGKLVRKNLMIDIIVLKRSYEAREIEENWWICGKDNSVDLITKTSSNLALESDNFNK